MKICFLNPFGTDIYNSLIAETLLPFAAAGTELVIRNTTDCPETIDFFYSKHLIETAIFEEVIRAEKEGFDAVIVGCCYDPGVRVARELVDIPVIGPLEASIKFAPYFGHDFVVVTDHHKAIPSLRDNIRLYAGTYCRDVTCINWWSTDMVNDTEAVARDALAAVVKALKETDAEVAIFGCTLVSACVEKHLINADIVREHTILNPNTMALKMAESLAALKMRGAYNISRKAFYQKHEQYSPAQYETVRAKFGRKSQ